LRIWVVHPYDELPNASDVVLRYWALSRALAAQGHEVIWWSSDFSHRRKKRREPCPPTDGFSVRLIPTSPYQRNISFARLKNHRQFAKRFRTLALEALETGELQPPHRIVVSLPPLGIAESAFAIRDFLQNSGDRKQAEDRKQEDRGRGQGLTQPQTHHSPLATRHTTKTAPCEVIVDIMDTWPETFHLLLPRALPDWVGKLALRPLYLRAKRAYCGADKISAVGQSYLDLAQQYLGQKTEDRKSVSHPSPFTIHPSSAKPMPPMHLCYHGTDLERFQFNQTEQANRDPQSSTQPMRAVYIGAMGASYDLMPLIEVADRWKSMGELPWQLHFGGGGNQASALQARCKELGLGPDRVVWHGFVSKTDIQDLLLHAQLALVTNRSGGNVACPYKASEYAAAGLPILSCLQGEFSNLLKTWNAGSEYKEGDPESLQAAFENYSNHPELLTTHGHGARQMAATLFDRSQTYPRFADFIVESSCEE
jgi:glycosyltransferase involved in cell wall biosynthesis